MRTFNSFEKFYEHLIKSICNEEDVYVFGYSLDGETDYQCLQEEKTIDYYVTDGLDLVDLQTRLHFTLVRGEELDIIISLDWVYDENDDHSYKRLFIFRK